MKNKHTVLGLVFGAGIGLCIGVLTNSITIVMSLGAGAGLVLGATVKKIKAMNKEEKLEMLNISKKLHSQVEASYLSDSAKKGDDKWLEKQRILLADMALHLLQTAISPDEIKLDLLRNNIHSILTISDQFLPGAKLKETTRQLYNIKV